MQPRSALMAWNFVMSDWNRHDSYIWSNNSSNRFRRSGRVGSFSHGFALGFVHVGLEAADNCFAGLDNASVAAHFCE